MVMYNLYLNKWVGEVFYEFKATQAYKSSSGIARNLSQKKKKLIMKQDRKPGKILGIWEEKKPLTPRSMVEASHQLNQEFKHN